MAPKFIFAKVWRGESLVQCKRDGVRPGVMAWPSNHSAGEVETADSRVGSSYPNSEIWPRKGFFLKVDGICRTTLEEIDCWPTHVDTHGHACASI